MVKVSYSGGTAYRELYYSDEKKNERYQCISMSKSSLLRPSENVNGYENIWIIISEKYKIQYNKNTNDFVKNIPQEQEKYWNENIILSNNQIIREGYIIEKEKHWNTKNDGRGTVHFPGTVYKENGNAILYANWKKTEIKKIYINAVDRYYVINQEILLDSKELLKKVTTDDDRHTGKPYSLRVTKIECTNHSNVVTGTNIATEKYMNTNVVNQYILTVETEDEKSKVKAISQMSVYVLNKDLINGQVRFISFGYMHTLDRTSKWSKGLKDKLVTSLKKNKNSVYHINISSEDVKEIKNNIKKNNYKINKEMNKSVVRKLDI